MKSLWFQVSGVEDDAYRGNLYYVYRCSIEVANHTLEKDESKDITGLRRSYTAVLTND